MNTNFVLFQKFTSQSEAVAFGKLLNENKIDCSVENISVNFDPILSNNEFGNEFCVKINSDDFEKAHFLLQEKAKAEISEIPENYYLLSFTDEELFDVVKKSDEWNKYDVELAHKLLKDRGKEINDQALNEIKQQRIAELSKPEEGQNIYITIGYIAAVLGGILGVFIGWHLLSFKKALPNGSRIYAYSQNDRKQGNRILILAIIFVVFWLSYFLLK